MCHFPVNFRKLDPKTMMLYVLNPSQIKTKNLAFLIFSGAIKFDLNIEH